MTGREKCKILREIRRRIARTNHIPYPEEDCDYEGEDCTGTCPRCELEIEYLEMSLSRKRRDGENVVINRYMDNNLRFQPLRAPGPGEDPMELVIFDQADWSLSPETHLALSKAGIITVGDLFKINPNYLIRYYHIETCDIDRMSEMLRRMGLVWGNRRRSRYENIRGMMRGPRD